MKTVGRKATSIILSLSLIVGTMLIVCPPLTAMAITENEVITRLENCKTTYVNGGVWCGTYYANNGSEGPWECFGFACEIFRMLYDCEMPRSYTGSTYNGATRYYKLVVNQYSNVTEVGSLAPGSYNSSQMRALLSQAKAGYVIQAANSRSQHTMIVNYVTDYGISVYDANSDGHNGIRSDASYSWDEFYNWRPYGVSLYKYIYYENTLPTPPTNVWISLPNGPESSYLQNEPVNITFGADNATSYRMEMYREYNGETSWYYGATFTSGICYASFDKLGHYSCYVFACNSGGETSSQWIGWDIVDSKPSALSITTDETYYGINSTVKFTLNAQYGYYKHIGVHRILDTGNQLYYEQDVVGTNCSVTITEAGNYYADFDAFNACGRTRSDKVYFTVFENKPGKPIVTVTPGSSKTETVISWSTTTDTKYYDIYIIQDGKILQYVTDFQEKTYSILLPKGTYQVDVCACGYVYDWWTASGYQPFVIDDIPYLAPADSYTVIDSETHLIYGFQKRNSTPMNNLLDDGLISITGGDGYITHEYSNNKNVIGTDTRIRLFNADSELIDTYTVIIFGDVNGDGWYDGTDAYFVRLAASGMIPATALTEAQRMAADCNHDGNIDAVDAALLEQAGLLLANVDQTLPSDELQNNSVYLEYCSLIDQTVEIIEPDQPAQTAEQPAAPSVWGWIKALFTVVLNWLLRVF